MSVVFILCLIFFIMLINKVIFKSYITFESVLPLFYLVLLFFLSSGLYLEREISVISLSVVILFSVVFYAVSFFTLGYCNKKSSTNEIVLNEKSLSRYLSAFSLFLLFYIAYYVPEALQLMLVDSIANYRSSINGFGDDGSVLFGKGIELFVYQFFFKGILVSVSIVSSVIFHIRNVKLPIYIVTLVILLDCIVSFGRFILYYHFVTFVVVGFIYSKLNIRKLLLSTSLLLIFIVIFTLFRFENFSDLVSVVVRNIVGYHVFGFALFDYYLTENMPEVIDVDGLVFLANFQYILQKIINIFGYNLNTFMSTDNYRDLSEFVFLGKDVFDNNVYANAFYTNLLDFYLDAGVFSVLVYTIIISSLYSFLLFKVKSENSILCVFLFSYLFLIVYFGVFNSQLLLMRNVFSLLFLVFLYFLFFKKYKWSLK